MINVHGLRRNVKNVVKNYSDAQVKVREATSNDPWGPSGTLMSEIADLTYNVVAFSEIMQVIWKRLNDHGKNWKHVYKALVLLEYLMKTGSEKVAQQCRENIFAIETLRDFQYFEESKDQGVNVREKAKQLVALLRDNERLKIERDRALQTRTRFARATSYVKQDSNTKHYKPSEDSQGSFDEDMLSPGALSLSELEHARPQTLNEEQLQLQLALAMSKEEADQAERLKRNDDLRLQMALSESEEEFKKVQVSKEKQKMTQSASAVEDLLGLSLIVNENTSTTTTTTNTPAVDPWGLPVAPKNSNSADNVWNSSTVVPEQNKNNAANDPWAPTSVAVSKNANMNTSTSYSGPQDNQSESNAFDMTGMKKSISADVCIRPVSQGSANSLDAFLNPDSSLIHFDPAAARSRTLGNPFQTTRPSSMTINEIRAQNNTQALPVSTDDILPTSTSMPLQSKVYTNASFLSQNTSSQNPFL